MVVNVKSIGLIGMESFDVTIESDMSKSGGIPSVEIEGNTDVSIKEARNRVRSAITNCGFPFPQKKILVNLAPADVKKTGSIYDFPISVSILILAGLIKANLLRHCAFIGELSLSGDIRPVDGVLPMTVQALKSGIKYLFVPYENAAEGAVIEGINIMPVRNIKEVVYHFGGHKIISPAKPDFLSSSAVTEPYFDFSEVKGQHRVKRAVEIAACGGHNILFMGSPGAGKSMIAKRIPTILPDMTFDEMIETTKVYSVAGLLPKNSPLISRRPFRSPHHTISYAGLSGGGKVPKPGELSLSHNGVLFLDELPEFRKNVMEVLRQPIEDGKITISRANATITYPCSIMLVAAMNPCPCGYFGHPSKKCTCSAKQVSSYLSKISGPLLDRIDMHIEVPPVEFKSLSDSQKSESSAEIKKRVDRVREIQNQRFKNTGIRFNAKITPALLQEMCPMSDKAKLSLQKSFDLLGLSARAYDKILKIARTVADLDNSEVIGQQHIYEAVQYRSLDRKYWKK